MDKKCRFSYNAIHSNGNCFWEDVILDSCNKVYKDEGSILDQKYKRNLLRSYYEVFFYLKKLNENNAYLKK